MLLDNLIVVPMDGPPERPTGRIVRGAAIRLDGGRIAAIGALAPRAGEPRLDCQGLVALPGFVQGHVHLCQTLFRGLADDLPLLDWLRARIWPLEAAHDPDSVRASAELAIHELLRGGTTTVQVMETVRHTEATFAALARSGMTALCGNCLMDVDGPELPRGMVTSAREALRIADELRRAFHGRGRLRYAVSPRFVLSCSDALARDAAGFARQHGLRVHTHACEHPAEVDAVRARFGRDYLQVLDQQELLGPHAGLAHCVQLTDDEHAVLRRTGAAVLHCPSANLKLGSGVADVVRLRRAGIRVALGADGAACNNRLSALTELRQAALLQAWRAGPGAWPAAQALYAATRGGAEALGLADELGSLAPQKRADLVLLALDDSAADERLCASLVWRATDADVRHVVLGGELAVRDGVVQGLDAAAVAAAADTARDRVLQRAGLHA